MTYASIIITSLISSLLHLYITIFHVVCNLIMPKINGTDDPHIKEAVNYIIKWPDMKVPQAMKLVGFSKMDCADKAKRMWICRCLPLARIGALHHHYQAMFLLSAVLTNPQHHWSRMGPQQKHQNLPHHWLTPPPPHLVEYFPNQGLQQLLNN